MSRTSASRVKVRAGDQIPSIGLRASDGFLLNLRSFVTKQPVAFLFFGAATMQGAARRTGHKLADALATGHERLREAGIAVVGVSCDNEKEQLEYIAEHKLPFLLFSDERRAAVGALGIPTVSSGDNFNVAAPAVVAVDVQGIVRSVIEKPSPEAVVELVNLTVHNLHGTYSGYHGDIVQPFDDAKPSIPVPFVSSRWGSLASFGARPYPNTKKWYGTSGNSFVAVVEFGKDSVRARAVSAGGESGDPKSPHFNDQAQRYATGNLREVYFYPNQLAGHTERTYHPGQ